MTRLEEAKLILNEKMNNLDESKISYAHPRCEHKNEILSDIFYDIFNCNPTKEEQKWLDEEDRKYQLWLATEF